MKPAARVSIIAGVAGVAAGTITALPVVATADSPAHDIRLAAGWQDMLDAQLSFNSSLIEHWLDANGYLVDVQHKLVPSLAILLGARVDPDDHYAIHGLPKDAVEQFFDANNAGVGAGEAGLFGVLGARGTMSDGTFTPLDLEGLNASVLVDARHEESIPFAGLESALGHYLGSAVFLSAALSGTPESEVETDPTADSFANVVTDVNTFNQAILDAEKAFDTGLTAAEINLEQAVFGTDSAYNGVVNHIFNAFNMIYDAQQQGFNGLLGITGYDPPEYTGSLLTTGDQGGQVFGDGNVGGLLGMFNQGSAALTQLGGLLQGAPTGIPDGFKPDPGAVSGAFGALMKTLSSGSFGDVFASGGAFSELLADLQNLFTTAAGS